ncbi:Hypothetical protein MVR_LOCUS286 [uncultured virus]|nr:Hypothetical protein MVR_LOCUS286 [uncultured virus]
MPYNFTFTITKRGIENINKDRIQPNVDEIIWEAGPLNAQVLAVFVNLKVLYCRHNRLTSLAGLEGCPNLQILHCGYNELVSLVGLEGCPNLRILHSDYNQLTSLTGIEGCPQLEKLVCDHNQLTTLAGIECCGHLMELDCNRNQLTLLAGIEVCIQLHTLSCGYNRLASLVGIEGCPELREVTCQNNEIASLEHIVYLRKLTRIWHHNNPLDVQSIPVSRFLARLEGSTYRSNITIRASTVYDDRQNVHDIHIQKTVCESLRRLQTDPKPMFSIKDITSSSLSACAIRLLQRYCSDSTIHSAHLLTYAELLAYVWARIVKHEHRDELIKILGEQVLESEGKCFTGRINRLVSVLAGFCDDIVIEISDNSRIGAIIVAAKYGITPYDLVKHRDTAHKLLTEAGYDALTIKPWLGAITEP